MVNIYALHQMIEAFACGTWKDFVLFQIGVKKHMNLCSLFMGIKVEFGIVYFQMITLFLQER